MADGRVLIDSKIDSSGAAKGAEQISDELEKIAKEAKDTANKTEDNLDGAFDVLVEANVLADLAVEALQAIGEAAIDMAKEAIEAAADIRASNAQFKQTFKDVEKQARSSLEAIADETGITATRMQDAYTGIFAFTRSLGAETDAALDISSRAMIVAADSAAYYDKSIEEVTETLQSFLKGNYENDAALGIAATETTRNTMANQLYAKSFQELSEAQKVDVLLAMVEAGNQASGAMGQAAREAESWTNVTGELEEAWRLFLGAVGDPVLDALLPVVQDITKALKEMTESLEYQKLKKSLKTITDGFEDAKERFEAVSDELEQNAGAAEYYASRLQELESAGLNTASAQREYAYAVQRLNEIFPELNLQISEYTGRVNQSKDAILASVEAMKQKALYTAMEERYTAVLSAQADAILLVKQAEMELTALEEKEAEISTRLEAAKAVQIEQTQKYGAATAEATSTVETLTAELNANQAEQERLNSAIDSSNKAIADQDKELKQWAESMDKSLAGLNDVVAGQGDMSEAADEARASVQGLREEYNAAKDAALASINSQIGLFDELSDKSGKSAEEIIKNWQNQKAAFDNYASNLEAAVDMGLDEALVKQLADGSEESMQILEEFVNGTDMSVDDINAAFEDVSESKETVASIMAEIQTDMMDRLEKMRNNTQEEFGSMATIVNAEIIKMQGYINSLTGKTVYVNVVTKTSGTSAVKSSASSTVVSPYSVEPYSLREVPYLASGAVIPPNAPFTAVLGDQRHGTNLEAPESLIRKIVREEAGSNGGTYQFVAQINRRVLFDEFIEEAKERQFLTGNDPFSLS